jgi:hypothetical protein
MSESDSDEDFEFCYRFRPMYEDDETKTRNHDTENSHLEKTANTSGEEEKEEEEHTPTNLQNGKLYPHRDEALESEVFIKSEIGRDDLVHRSEGIKSEQLRTIKKHTNLVRARTYHGEGRIHRGQANEKGIHSDSESDYSDDEERRVIEISLEEVKRLREQEAELKKLREEIEQLKKEKEAALKAAQEEEEEKENGEEQENEKQNKQTLGEDSDQSSSGSTSLAESEGQSNKSKLIAAKQLGQAFYNKENELSEKERKMKEFKEAMAAKYSSIRNDAVGFRSQMILDYYSNRLVDRRRKDLGNNPPPQQNNRVSKQYPGSLREQKKKGKQSAFGLYAQSFRLRRKNSDSTLDRMKSSPELMKGKTRASLKNIINLNNNNNNNNDNDDNNNSNNNSSSSNNNSGNRLSNSDSPASILRRVSISSSDASVDTVGLNSSSKKDKKKEKKGTGH